MAKVTIKKSDINQIIDLGVEGKEKISLFGTTIERIEQNEIDLEVSANRPDLLSPKRLLHSLKVYLGKQKGIEYTAQKSDYEVIVDSSVKEVRPFARCAVIKNIKLNEDAIKELIELQEKLHATVGRNRKKVAIGIYPLEKITFPVTYLAKAPKDIEFIPLGSKTSMSANQILEKHPTGQEFKDLLKNEKKYPLFIDAKKQILSMPPLINSETIGRVEIGTKDLFIECTGNHEETLEQVLTIIVTTCADMGGKILEVTLKDTEKIICPNLSPLKRNLNLKTVNKVLGLSLTETELKQLLERMEHGYSKGIVSSPPWRGDILHEIDLVEDVAIAYGYNKLVPTYQKEGTIGEENEMERFKRKIRELSTSLGFLEIVTPHLITEEEIIRTKDTEALYIESSKSEFVALRKNLRVPLMRILSKNTHNGYPQRLFEIGTVFEKDDQEETGIREKTELILGISPTNYTGVKQILDYFAILFEKEVLIEETSFIKEGIPGRTAKIKCKDEVIGYIYEVHPNILKEWKLKMPLAVIEFNLDVLKK